MAAGFVDVTVTTKTGTDVTFHCWVPDTGSPTVGAIPLRMATDANGVPIDATHPMFAQLIAGSALVGKFGIDQTTPGTTNLVSVAASTTDVVVTPTVTASAYTAGNVIGGIMTFASILAATSFNGVLHSITAKFKGAAVTGALQVAIFKANPSNGTYTDKTAATWNAADMANLLGIYSLPLPNSKLGTMTVYNLDAIGKAIVGASQSLFVVVLVDGTPTPASASDFSLELSVLPG